MIAPRREEMGSVITRKLVEIELAITSGLDSEGTLRVLELLGDTSFSLELLRETKLFSEYLPKAAEHPFTEEQRCLHFLWDALEKLPISLSESFSIPFRRLLACHLFKRCGKNFISERNVCFNFGQFLDVGNDVFLNAGVYLDSKGGITLGDYVCLTEDVKIFTHTHSESDHAIRTYKPVVIKDFAKIYTRAIILPGVTIGEQAIVAADAMVAHDIPPNTVAAGIPARVIRDRHTEGRKREDLDQIWLYKGAFQND
jgi:acetyltransferase-like isoleucine patch superfamily enzyme